MTSDDISVGADAFLTNRAQILLDLGVQFVRYHDDPFRQVSWVVRRMNVLAGNSHQELLDYAKHAMPAKFVRSMMKMIVYWGMFQHGGDGQLADAAQAWRNNIPDDDLVVMGVAFYEFPDKLKVDPDWGPTWATAK